jgi:hypothetical protein
MMKSLRIIFILAALCSISTLRIDAAEVMHPSTIPPQAQLLEESQGYIALPSEAG